jgi:hypothetical protein
MSRRFKIIIAPRKLLYFNGILTADIFYGLSLKLGKLVDKNRQEL